MFEKLIVAGSVFKTRAGFELRRVASRAFRREVELHGGWAWFPILEERGGSLELYRKPGGAWGIEVIVEGGCGEGEEYVEHFPLRLVGEAVDAYNDPVTERRESCGEGSSTGT